MGFPMESADSHSSHQALLDLERDKTAPVELLESVALILGVKYEVLGIQLTARAEDEAEQNDVATRFAPKEEWVLRWLLKRSGLSGLPSKVKTTEADAIRMCSDGRTWLLINHLLIVVPHGVLAKVLAENEFLIHLERCLPAVLQASVEDAAGEVPKKTPSKKRKRPSAADASQLSSTSANGVYGTRSVGFLIGLALHRLAQIVELDTHTSEHIRLALSAPVSVTASLIGKLISDLTISFAETPDAVPAFVVKIIAGTVKVWNHRMYDGLEEGIQNRAFTIECLQPLLGILARLNNSGSEDCSGLTNQIERLIALHCVLPSRNAFFREYSDAAQDSERTKEHLRAALLPSAPSGEGPEIAFLLDTAVRSISKGNLRRRQHEQPWFETLFFMLVDRVSKEDLGVLLSTAIKQKLELSRARLSQLALNQISSSPIEWSMMAKIVEMNAGICLPTSPCTLENLFDHFDDNNSTSSVETIRDGVLSPILRTFARSRELTTFITVWHGYLAKKIDSEGTIWQDEQLSAVFRDILKEYPTSISIRSMLEQVIGDVLHATDDANGGPDAHASLAIIDSVLVARSEDCKNEEDLLRTLSRSCRSWLKVRPADAPQRWRWWRIIRRIQHIFQEGQLDPTIEPMLVFFDLESNGVDTQLEAVECFHLVCELFGRNAGIANLVEKHLDGLAAQISQRRAAAVSGLSNVARACMAIMLQQSHVLSFATTTKLWPVLWHCVSDPTSTSGNIHDRYRQMYKTFLMSEIITDDAALVRHTFDIIFDTFQTGHQTPFVHQILTDLPLQHVKKPKLEDLAGFLIESLKPNGGIEPHYVLSASALLARIVQVAKVSIGRVQAWSQLQDFIEQLSETCQSKHMKPQWRDSIAMSAQIIATAVQHRAKASSNTELKDQDFEELSTLFNPEPLPVDAASTQLTQLEQLASTMSSHPFNPEQMTNLINPTSFEHFCLTADSIKLCLSSKSITHQANQYTIDTLLSTLATVTSPHGGPSFPSLPSNGPSAIYQRLTSLLGAVRSHHRHRLGGRYHLLVPVLQSLLRCLFRPHPIPPSAKQPRIQDAHPPWLKLNTKLTSTFPLTSTSSTQLTRLLTSITSPTASAVRRHHHNPKTPSSTSTSNLLTLTDSTKTARALSGQYLHYLILSYCTFQLQGILSPDVKNSLMPGLYAVLDVMTRDGMRAMNAAMGASERAIWKGLYDDWRMFGRWDGR